MALVCPPASSSDARKRQNVCFYHTHRIAPRCPSATVLRSLAPVLHPCLLITHRACAEGPGLVWNSLRKPPPSPSQPPAAQVDVLFPDSCTHSPLLVAETLSFILVTSYCWFGGMFFLQLSPGRSTQVPAAIPISGGSGWEHHVLTREQKGRLLRVICIWWECVMSFVIAKLTAF